MTMLNQWTQADYFYSLDLGAHKLKACALKVNDKGDCEVAGIYEATTHGFGDVSVVDLHELSESIHQIIEKLEGKTGIKAKQIQLGINGDLIFVRPANTVIPLIDRGLKVISKKDIDKINHHARLLGVKMDEDILHELPMSYTVDETNTAVNPLGLYGRTLGIDALLIGTRSNVLRNITKAVHQAGYDVENVFFSSYAAAFEVLSEESRAQGVCLIDVGAKVTSILIFKDNALKYVDIIKIGGEDLTRNIASRINVAYDLADEIKKSYALAIASPQHYDEEILIKKERNYVPIRREVICQAIQPPVTQMIKAIDSSLRNSGYYHALNQGIVLIGGGALLPGLIESIGESTNLNVQLGKMHRATHKHVSNAALFATVIGLAHSAHRKSSHKALPESAQPDGWAKNAMNRIVELYNEYF